MIHLRSTVVMGGITAALSQEALRVPAVEHDVQVRRIVPAAKASAGKDAQCMAIATLDIAAIGKNRVTWPAANYG